MITFASPLYHVVFRALMDDREVAKGAAYHAPDRLRQLGS
jgi:hypothetical protein